MSNDKQQTTKKNNNVEVKIVWKIFFINLAICFFEGCAALSGVVFSCMIIAYFLKLYGVVL